MKRLLSTLLVFLFVAYSFGQNIIYVSKKGSNKNPGTDITAPKKNIDKAIKIAKKGDKIYIAGGKYSGTFSIGYIRADKAISLYGSFDDKFAKQDIVAHPTIFAPANKSAAAGRKALFSFSKGPIDNVVIDHIVWDRGNQNSYSPTKGKPAGFEGTGMLLFPPAKAPGENATVKSPLIAITASVTASNITISNCAFVNGSSFGVQAGMRSGKLVITNCVFVNNVMAAAEVYGTCGDKSKPCVDIEFSYNTVMFTTTRTKDLGEDDMGRGFRIRTKATYDINHNIFMGNMSAVDHVFFAKDEWVKMNDNIFAVNKAADFFYTPSSGNALRLKGEELEELDIEVTGNKYEVPANIPVDAAYLNAFLNSFYKEKATVDDNMMNQWRQSVGLPKQGTIKSSVSFYANKYSQSKALELFGAVKDYGPQKK